MIELRCRSKKFGELIRPSLDEGTIEFSCPSRWCGKRSDVTVLHAFSTATGKLLTTRQFRSPKGGKQ